MNDKECYGRILLLFGVDVNCLSICLLVLFFDCMYFKW